MYDRCLDERGFVERIKADAELFARLIVMGPVSITIGGESYVINLGEFVSYRVALGRELGCVAVTFGLANGGGQALYTYESPPKWGDGYGAMHRLAQGLGGRLVAVDWSRDCFTVEVYSAQLAQAQDTVRTDG